MDLDYDIFGVSRDEILFFPSGDINSDCLENLLSEVYEKRLKNSNKILCA